MTFRNERRRLGQPLDIFIVNSFSSLFQVGAWKAFMVHIRCMHMEAHKPPHKRYDKLQGAL
jgi:hypothetical protein